MRRNDGLLYRAEGAAPTGRDASWIQAYAGMKYLECFYITHGDIVCVGTNIFMRAPPCIGDFDA